MSPEQTLQFFDNDYKNWAEVVRETGVRDQVVRDALAHPQTNFNPPFDITRASHLVFTVRDLAASKAFYTEVIGLKVSAEDDLDALAARRRGTLSSQPDPEEDP